MYSQFQLVTDQQNTFFSACLLLITINLFLATLPQHANMDFNHDLSLAMGCRLVAIITLAFIILTGTYF